MSLKFILSAAHRRAGTHDVIDDRESLAAHARAESRRQAIACRVQTAGVYGHYAFGETKLDRERLRYELRKKCATEQRSTNYFDIVGSKRLRELRNKRLDALRVSEESIEIQPKFAVIARLELEVTPTTGRQLKERCCGWRTHSKIDFLRRVALV
jgi:hypothetical protein